MYLSFNSAPIYCLFSFFATYAVVPAPMNGSRTSPLSGQPAKTHGDNQIFWKSCKMCFFKRFWLTTVHTSRLLRVLFIVNKESCPILSCSIFVLLPSYLILPNPITSSISSITNRRFLLLPHYRNSNFYSYSRKIYSWLLCIYPSRSPALDLVYAKYISC